MEILSENLMIKRVTSVICLFLWQWEDGILHMLIKISMIHMNFL